MGCHNAWRSHDLCVLATLLCATCATIYTGCVLEFLRCDVTFGFVLSHITQYHTYLAAPCARHITRAVRVVAQDALKNAQPVLKKIGRDAG